MAPKQMVVTGNTNIGTFSEGIYSNNTSSPFMTISKIKISGTTAYVIGSSTAATQINEICLRINRIGNRTLPFVQVAPSNGLTTPTQNFYTTNDILYYKFGAVQSTAGVNAGVAYGQVDSFHFDGYADIKRAVLGPGDTFEFEQNGGPGIATYVTNWSVSFVIDSL